MNKIASTKPGADSIGSLMSSSASSMMIGGGNNLSSSSVVVGCGVVGGGGGGGGGGANTTIGSSTISSFEKNKQWQRELLMERLRSHSTQHKTFHELSRSMRMSMLEKRYALDAVEKLNLQKCLDSMQYCIKVKTRQGLVERLESLSRQLGLKFMEDTSGLFISSDMFYLEIILDKDGKLCDVKVHHECKIEQQSCSELVQCLLNGDFVDFTIQLEGLSSIYQLNAEPKIKSKAFIALQAIETDLYNLYTMEKNLHHHHHHIQQQQQQQQQQQHLNNSIINDPLQLLMNSQVGIVQKRRGGHSMKLIYFITPYDLLNLETNTINTLTYDLLQMKPIGMYVSVNLEASSANKLQIIPTVTFNKDLQSSLNCSSNNNDNYVTPIYSSMNSNNSTLLPATFVLRLSKPLPICKILMNTLTHLNNDVLIGNNNTVSGNNSGNSSIIDLIVQTASDGQMKNCKKGLNVNLPDQNHLYYFTENKAMTAAIVTSIPFTEPSQVPKILAILRKQALFYTLLSSCVRPISKAYDIETTIILEVNPISITQISVSLEHPYEESMVNIEFDLTDCKNIKCSICSLMNNYNSIALRLSKIVQKSLSIPITVRALLKYWEQERMKPYRSGSNVGSGGGSGSMENGNFNLGGPLGPNDPGGRNNTGNCDYRDIKIKTERGMGGGSGGSGGISGTNGSNGGSGIGNNCSGNFMSGNNGNGGRQFFHGSSGGTMMNDSTFNTTTSIFDTSTDGSGGGRFRLSSMNKSMTNHDIEMSMVPKFSQIGEDFYKSPKSNNSSNSNSSNSNSSVKAESGFFCNDFSSSDFSGDSGSLGMTTTMATTTATATSSDSGVTNTHITAQTAQKNFQKLFTSDSDKRTKETADNSTRQSVKKIENSSNSELTTTTSKLNSVLTGMGLEKRPGIEIRPISSSNIQIFQQSITITPIVSSGSGSKSSKKHGDSSSSVRRSSSSSSDDKLRSNDKKRKRKKDDMSSPSSSMGGGQMGPPPEKQISKSNSNSSVNRNVSGIGSVVTGMPTSSKKDSSRKQSVNNSALSVMSMSNNTNQQQQRSNTKHSSSMYSPTSKSQLHSGTSPKHGTSAAATAGSGKPSMLALKNATNPTMAMITTTNSKGDKIAIHQKSSLSKEKDRSERDKDSRSIGKTSTTGNSPKFKSSTVKLKQIDLSAALLHNLESGGVLSEDDSKIVSNYLQSTNDGGASTTVVCNTMANSLAAAAAAAAAAQSKIRKGSLSAVIDKLKSAQHPDDGILSDPLGGADLTFTTPPSSDNVGLYNLNSDRTTTALGSEYMIKPSLDGMKITINKTRTKDNSSSSSTQKTTSSLKLALLSGSSGSSPKKHTGLKPGVLSGPASRKGAVSSLLKSTSPSNSGSSSGSGLTKSTSGFQRTNSASNLTLTGSKNYPLNPSDLYRKDKSFKTSKNSSGVSGSGGSVGDSKQLNSSRADPFDVMKILRLSSPNNSMDGFMKSLNTKFQIPKLSARTNDDTKKESSSKESTSTSNTTTMTTAAVTTAAMTTMTTSRIHQNPVSITTTTVTNASSVAATTVGGISSTVPLNTTVLGGSTGSSSTSQNSEVIAAKSLSEKMPQQQQTSFSKILTTSESSSLNVFCNDVNLGGNKTHFFSSTSPSSSSQQQQQQQQLSKSSSSDAILSASFHHHQQHQQQQKDCIIKPHSVSTPTTPMHVQSPFTSPVSNVAMTNSSPIYRPSPSASPNVQFTSSSGGGGGGGGSNSNSNSNSGFNDSLTMRPPSAPCTVDMTKVCNESVSIVQQQQQQQQRSVTPNTPQSSSLLPSLASSTSTQSSSFPAAITATKRIAPMTPSQHSKAVVAATPSPSPSSSVSIHIVKSPVPSPLMLLSSPHSGSPCITDEDIDETSSSSSSLVTATGIKGK